MENLIEKWWNFAFRNPFGMENLTENVIHNLFFQLQENRSKRNGKVNRDVNFILILFLFSAFGKCDLDRTYRFYIWHFNLIVVVFFTFSAILKSNIYRVSCFKIQQYHVFLVWKNQKIRGKCKENIRSGLSFPLFFAFFFLVWKRRLSITFSIKF